MPGQFAYDNPSIYDTSISYDSYAPSSTGSEVTVLPHLSAAMSLSPDGSFAFLQQDTLDEVSQSVEMICGSVTGSRTVVPNFGLPDQAFTLPNANVIATQINKFETRAALTINIDNQDSGVSSVQVGVSLAKKGTF